MTIKSDSFNKNKTTIKKSDSVLSIMELILQCVLFESFILMEYMGVFLINDSRVYMCLWVIPAVIWYPPQSYGLKYFLCHQAPDHGSSDTDIF